jgi:hypothetical protein
MRTVNTQQIGAVARQVLAIAGIVMGVITASVTSLHLPTAVSSILVVAGSVVLAIEHYVSDPSTGTPAPPVGAPPSLP